MLQLLQCNKKKKDPRPANQATSAGGQRAKATLPEANLIPTDTSTLCGASVTRTAGYRLLPPYAFKETSSLQRGSGFAQPIFPFLPPNHAVTQPSAFACANSPDSVSAMPCATETR